MEVKTPSVPLWLQEQVEALSTDTLPDPLESFGPNSAAITPPAGDWAPVTSTSDLSFGELERPLEVVAHFSGVAAGTSGAYSMVGVRATGGLNIEPEYTAGGTVRFAYAPFSDATGKGTHISGVKRFVIPAGPETKFRLSFRRDAAVARNLNYSYLILIPNRWMIVPPEEPEVDPDDQTIV